MPTKKIEIKPDLVDGIQELCEQNNEVLMVSLCTTDGFSIRSVTTKGMLAEADKLAAMSSTISALSNSASKQIMHDQFDITIIETQAGNMLFVRTRYLKLPCVLTVAANANMALAMARFQTKRLAEQISLIKA